ncbi:MAG: hypothetical protein JJD97_06665 [Gemmatimonadaceae bacterium]|nr:hypothetical protein [Gemmatimonadaceae bacterium]
MTVTNGTRDESVVRYDDRLPVHGRALLPAIAMGVGAGLVVFYLARLIAERTPLVLEPPAQAPDRGGAPARTRG